MTGNSDSQSDEDAPDEEKKPSENPSGDIEKADTGSPALPPTGGADRLPGPVPPARGAGDVVRIPLPEKRPAAHARRVQGVRQDPPQRPGAHHADGRERFRGNY